MRFWSKLIGLIVLAGCVGPTPPPPPDYALRVIDAETVAFGAAFGGESPEEALRGALAALGWATRPGEGAAWACEDAGLRFDCSLQGEGREVVLVLRERATTASLEERGRLLATALGDRERRR